MKYLILLFLSFGVCAQNTWKPVSGKLLTPWTETLNPQNVHSEYPRPQMVRKEWKNLNGLWQYAIAAGKHGEKPTHFEGEILVPFAVESALSGVGRTVGKDSTMWYKKEVNIDKKLRKGNVLLHFGAVDWSMVLYVNKQKVGTHEGGYDPFYFDITKYLKKGEKQEIVISVWDSTNEGLQPNGKQVVNPHGIWYTPVTGIWQTVWLESVAQTHIEDFKINTDIETGEISISPKVASPLPSDKIVVSVWEGENKLAENSQEAGSIIKLKVNNAKLWSPDSPFLYRLKLSVLRNGKTIDEIDSYTAFRKISMIPDKDGIQRLALNNKTLFQYGPLDQGWWPDGLYTAPNDEALKFDIEKTKEMGFNMIRKHIKVEPARWYYYCDLLGIMVWQDMPSGDLGGNAWDMRLGNISGNNLEKNRSAESEAIYKKEWKSIINTLHNFQSIVVWVPFNEAWGQFKTVEISEWTKKYDPSRLVNSASGGNFFSTGDILDIHHYPEPQMPDPRYFGKDRALVLGEFGGLGLALEGHTWQEKNNWGYQSYKTKEDLKTRYAEFVKSLKKLVGLGLSAAVYTQTTDVEVETNGLMTYDRKVIKIPEKELAEMHRGLYEE